MSSQQQMQESATYRRKLSELIGKTSRLNVLEKTPEIDAEAMVNAVHSLTRAQKERLPLDIQNAYLSEAIRQIDVLLDDPRELAKWANERNAYLTRIKVVRQRALAEYPKPVLRLYPTFTLQGVSTVTMSNNQLADLASDLETLSRSVAGTDNRSTLLVRTVELEARAQAMGIGSGVDTSLRSRDAYTNTELREVNTSLARQIDMRETQTLAADEKRLEPEFSARIDQNIARNPQFDYSLWVDVPTDLRERVAFYKLALESLPRV
jgi:hypothetical protein